MPANGMKVKASKVMYVGMFFFVFGGLSACIVLILNGLKFESKYALMYLCGGVLFLPFFLYEALWSLPGFIPGKTFFTIYPGENGKITAATKTVQVKEIKNIDLKRNPINLLNDVIVETFEGKKIKLKTYNLVAEVQFYDYIDQYVFPYMRNESKMVWDRKISSNQLLKDIQYQRKNM